MKKGRPQVPADPNNLHKRERVRDETELLSRQLRYLSVYDEDLPKRPRHESRDVALLAQEIAAHFMTHTKFGLPLRRAFDVSV